MPVRELRCSSCHAPVDATQGALQSCRYCGATLVVEGAAETARAVERFAVVLARCGPSNAQRVAAVLCAHGIEPGAAEEFARKTPCDVVTWDDSFRAKALARALEEAGAQSEVATRVVMVPIPPKVCVILDEAGSNVVAVMRAIREYVDLGLAETKSLVGRAPCTLVDTIDDTRGRALHAALLAAGARARIATRHDIRP